ncbi:putative repeat protein [Orientia tsutsugamushi str. Gilliam]|uniref:Putative repeat protein n=1 Tax=Orientia tsutsugamushi str. Gilliam TaxID=1359184 RepID=A0A0F3M626_ORITS
MHRGSSTQFNIQAMSSIQLCKMLKDRDVLSKPIITEIYNRALFLLQTEDARYNRLQFDARGLATILYQFAKLNYVIGSEFIEAWTNQAINLMDEFSSQGLTNSLWGFGRLKIQPQASFIEAWTNQAINLMDEFNSQDLSNSLWGLGWLEIQPQASFIEAWTNQATKTIGKFNHQELANSIYGILTLNVLCNSKIKVPQLFISAVNQNIELFDENIEDIGQILKAHYYFGKQGVGILTSQNRQLLEKKFKTKLTPYHTSNLHLNVLKVVKKVLAQHTVKSEHYIKQITSSVDIFIKEKNTVIQVDGPYHFDDNNALNFSTRLNTELLKSYGYIV